MKSAVTTIPLVFDTAKEYTNANVTNRWDQERVKWLSKWQASTKSQGTVGTSLAQMIKRQARDTYGQRHESDVRGITQSKELPDDEDDPERRHARRIMKSQSGPYERFDNYYALEDIIDLYMEIWYDSDSGSDN